MVSPKDTVKIIEQAARNSIVNYLSKESDPAVVETELISVNVHEVREIMGLCLPATNDSQPRGSYREAYNTTLEKMAALDLDGGQLTRQSGLTSLLLSQTPIGHIKSANLIVEFCGSYPIHLPRRVLISL